MKNRKKNLGKLIQRHRLALGLKQEVVAGAALISQSKYCRIEHGASVPSFLEMVDMAFVLRQPLEAYLPEGMGPASPEP